MERCLSAKLSYYRGPTVEASASVRPVSVQGSTLTYSPAALDRQPLQARVFALAAAIADHAQALHDAQFGGGPAAEDPTGERDQIVGYLDRCLVADGVLPMATNNSPDDPRALYSKALGGLPSDSPRIDAFAYGYTSWPLAPAPLLPKSY